MRVEGGALSIGNLTAFLTYLMQILFSVLMAVLMFIFVPRAAVSADRIEEVLESEPTITRSRRARRATCRGRWCRSRIPRRRRSAIPVPSNRSCTTSRSSRRAGPDDRDRRQHGQRQVDAHQPHPALLRRDRRRRPVGRHRCPRDAPRGPLAHDRHDPADGIPVQRHRREQPALRRRGRHRRTDLARARDRPGRRTSWTRCPMGSIAPSTRAGATFPAVSASASPIARALVKRAPVYVFDDSFSALDFRTDARLRAASRDELGIGHGHHRCPARGHDPERRSDRRPR